MSLGIAATIIGLLVDSIEAVRLVKGLRDFLNRRKEGKSGVLEIPEEAEGKLRALIGGEIGSRLVEALISYVEKGSVGPIMELIDSIERKPEVNVLVDVSGRNPELMFKSQFGRNPEYIYKFPGGEMDLQDFPMVARSVAKLLELVNNLHPTAKKRVIFSAPVILAFQVGQLVGRTAKFYPLHLVKDSGYQEVASVV